MDRPDVGSRLRIRIGTAKDQGRGQGKVAGALAYLLRGTTLVVVVAVVGAASISMAAALEVAAVVEVATIQQADRRPDQVSSAWNSAVSSLSLRSLYASCLRVAAPQCFPPSPGALLFRRRRNALAKGHLQRRGEVFLLSAPRPTTPRYGNETGGISHCVIRTASPPSRTKEGTRGKRSGRGPAQRKASPCQHYKGSWRSEAVP